MDWFIVMAGMLFNVPFILFFVVLSRVLLDRKCFAGTTSAQGVVCEGRRRLEAVSPLLAWLK